MDYVHLLDQVIEKVLLTGKLLEAEWNRPGGPRGHGDKAEVDVEIEQQLRVSLLDLVACDYWGEETGRSSEINERALWQVPRLFPLA
ncbi:hypothetical protein D9M68_931550 [compost metagenome]